MAAGKSTVGRLVAERLGWPFVDLDAEVERIAGLPVPEIFRRRGEEAFRELEGRVTRELSLPRRAVVAAGGGWMARPELRDRWDGAVRVWLQVGASEAMERLRGSLDSRPMLGEDARADLRRLLEERRDDYAGAELRVATGGKAPDRVADEVIRALEDTGRLPTD